MELVPRGRAIVLGNGHDWNRDNHQQSDEWVGHLGISFFSVYKRYFSLDNKEILDNLDVLLRDQLRIGYLQGMHLKEPRFVQEYEANSQTIRSLIEMALILSSDTVAWFLIKINLLDLLVYFFMFHNFLNTIIYIIKQNLKEM